MTRVTTSVAKTPSSRTDIRSVCATTVLALLVSMPVQANDIFVSQSPDRTGAGQLQGGTVYGEIYVYFSTDTPDNAVDNVEFFIDGSQAAKDNKAPYDLAGGSTAIAHPYDTVKDLNDGTHSMDVVLTLKDGTQSTTTASFLVDNAFAPISPSSALRVVTATVNLDAGTITLVGFNFDRGSPPRVSLDLQPIDVSTSTDQWLIATLPSGV